MINLRAAATAAAVALTFATPALSQGLSFSFGASLTSNYISRGVTQSMDGPALQFYGEVETNGFYAGLWGSTVDLPPDDLEIDLYAGYRWSLGSTTVDVGYARYIYDSTGDCCGELYVNLSSEVGSTSFSGGIYYDPSLSRVSDINLGVGYDWGNSISTGLTVGRTDPGAGGHVYAVVDLGYSVNDNVSLSAAYHYSRAPGERRNRLVVSASVDF